MAVVLVILTVLTFLNIVVPISGSVTVTPILTFVVDPHTAVGLASILFFLSGIVRVVLFRNSIVWNEVRLLIFPSAIASGVGALTVGYVPAKWLFLVLFFATLYFFLKKMGVFAKRNTLPYRHLQGVGTGFFSGYLQGTGLAGSDMRNAYLMANGLSIEAVHGTSSLLGLGIFAVATLVRLETKQLDVADVMSMLLLFPAIVFATLLGRKALLVLSVKAKSRVITFVMGASVILLGYKTFCALFLS